MTHFSQKQNRIIVRLAFILCLFCFNLSFADEVPMKRLNDFARKMNKLRVEVSGYPCNQNADLEEFYKWFYDSKLCDINMNNVGDPQQKSSYTLNTHEFENEVIDFFAPLYGFSPEEAWGFVTTSGTDGNNHGMYFGVRQILTQTKKLPIVYVSEDAHYSIKKLADLQNLELRQIKTDVAGKMIIKEFEKALDPSKPALVVIAMGTTFKGAIDNQAEIAAVLRKKKPLATYIHLDAALFGGYLPFTKHKNFVDRKIHPFDSIAVSGHKFFGFDEPMGLFITTKKTLSQTNPFNVAYLDQAVPTITCSRSAIAPLKFWWKVKKNGKAGFEKQAEDILANAEYMEEQLESIGFEAWHNDYSNTIYFRRPGEAIMKKYDLAPEYDDRLGGKMAHLIVMQHVTKDVIDDFVKDIKAEMN